MALSQKCQYAVRAVFELAKRYGGGPVAITQIAKAQAIPAKFLEGILGQLRQGGFVQSRRGAQGGYVLARRPDELTMGEIIMFIDGPFDPVQCTTGSAENGCALLGRCVFIKVWQRARDAVAEVYQTTFQELLEQETACSDERVPNYCI